MNSKTGDDDLEGIRRGDKAALKLAWEAHADLVLFVARKFMSSRESAEDVVQEVFIKLATSGASIRDTKALRGWLAVATRNACIDQIRRSAKQVVTDPGEFSEVVAPESTATAREAELQLVGDLLDEVAREPGGDTLVLFYRDGIPVAEIARRRGEAIGTVTSRLTRLREKLRARVMAARQNEMEALHDK